MIDQAAMFSDNQDLTGAAVGVTKSTSGYDLGLPGTDALGNTTPHDAGMSEIAVEARVTTDFASAGAATVQAQLCSYTDAARTLNRVVHQETDAIPKATLVKGYRFALGKLPPGVTQEFLSLEYNVGTAALTAGKVTAYLAPNTFA